MITKKKIVIVGNGMVGHKFIEKFVANKDQSADFQLIVYGEEPHIAYDRVHLSEYFVGRSVDDLALTSRQWYEQQAVTFFSNVRVTEILCQEKLIKLDTGDVQAFDTLILATGSAPFVPPIPGIGNKGVFVYRTIEDLDQIIAYSQQSQHAAVIGGGLLGLEAAKALVELELDTHVIEMAPRLMPRQIDQEGSAILEKKIAELSVTAHLGKQTTKIVGKEDDVCGLAFGDGSQLPVDMVVVSAGIRPRDELAKTAGLAIGPRGGIIVNDFMQTSDPAIYAIGECALHEDQVYGLVAPGYRMAETAVNHILGVETPFGTADMSTKLKLLGVEVASVGNAFANGTSESVVFCDSNAGIYKKLIFEPSTNLLEGAILVGDAADYGQLLQMYLNKIPLPDTPHTLIVAGDESPAMGIDLLPDTAQICSCENVLKADLIEAIHDGNQTIPSLKSCTKSGTGCGSCVALMKDVLNNELSKMGVDIDKSICEHFDYTRQELGQIVRAMHIETFDELLGRYGSGGDGCEKCKPVAASLIATYRNSYLLDHQTIQDTNDYYLANIQKNGSYSIVPRVPGGEITPEQLIEIGRVAQDFNLYTKITGGQRIDLFGAYLNDLPQIWRRLNQVGLESGHAYAKGLRTVKSCVGKTWCRFGVQDSTTMAIDLENRYKGIRFPHKVKMAVSGCARECAEAQCKDVGVIATEKGWNLYLCGNGGMKPRHADLFVTDIDTETLIRYIDRFLMYYARTADHLMRTAKWMDQLPGGLDHLRDVIIEDKLGLNDELEQEMSLLVGTYQDEWATTINDPEKVKRFSYFVNSPEVDSNIRFKEMRGQKQPDVIELPVLN